MSRHLSIILAALLILGGIPPASASETDSVRNTPTLVLDFDTGFRILEDLEMCRIVREKNALLIQKDELQAERIALYRERIDFLKEQNNELHRMNTAAIKLSEQARPKWYQELFAAGKWIGLGIVLGFVGAVAK